jgi:hypothetical protein
VKRPVLQEQDELSSLFRRVDISQAQLDEKARKSILDHAHLGSSALVSTLQALSKEDLLELLKLSAVIIERQRKEIDGLKGIAFGAAADAEDH